MNPTAGADYTVYVHGFDVNGTASFTLFSWQVGSAPAGNMTVSAPTTATIGVTGTIGLSFSGLAPNTKYLGSVAYTTAGVTTTTTPTVVEVNTP